MKCNHCGTELSQGSLFCAKCGKSVQIVPDYNVYEEDYLKQVLREENRVKDQSAQHAPGQTADSRKKKKQLYLILGIAAALLLIVLLAVFLISSSIKKRNAGSFDYQIQMAESAYRKGDTETAIAYYENALALDKDNVNVRLTLAQIYMGRKDYDSVLILCQEVMQMDSANREACQMLISVYEEHKNYDAVTALYGVADESLYDLFAAYIVTPPVFGRPSGTYDAVFALELTAGGDYTIYYSMDGSDPTLRGERYSAPIELNENLKTYEIRAVCMNEKGIYSDVVQGEYKIDLPAPDMPAVTPDGGDFGVETVVMVAVPSGCSAYYTWDGSDPNIYSAKYTGPITVPEGNNVLSVIVMDDTTELFSDIYRGNFIYYPQEEDGGESLVQE